SVMNSRRFMGRTPRPEITDQYSRSEGRDRSKNDLLMSALGQKQTFGSGNPMSAIPPKADIEGRDGNVRFVPKADSCTATKKPSPDYFRCAIAHMSRRCAPLEDRSRVEWNVSAIASTTTRTLVVRWTPPIDTAARSIFHQFHQPPSLPVRSTPINGDAHRDSDEQTISR
ncbi:MAG TPA: hypothetical protein VF760_14660, partial [Xanthobacteraceae bacterium]